MKSRFFSSPELSPKFNIFRIFLPEVLLLCFSAVLLFTNLSGSYLWEDEAETALLGRNILSYGVPRAYDGKNIISQEEGKEYDEHYIWHWSSWGDKYIAAASLRVFGETTFGARFLFVLLGFVSIIIFYLTTRQVFPSLWIGRLSTLFYVTSLPFLLHVRQCRYYSLVTLCSVLMLFLLFRRDRRRKHWIAFAVTAFFLFHSNYFLCGMTLGAFIATVLVFRLIKEFEIKEYIVGIFLAGVISFPGLLYYRSYDVSVKSMLTAFPKNFIYYLIQVNDYFYPFVLCIASVVLMMLSGKTRSAGHASKELSENTLLQAGACYTVVYILFLSFAPFSFFRYLLPLFPIFAILTALSVSLVAAKNKIAAVLLSSLLIFSNVLNIIPGRIFHAMQTTSEARSFLYEYAYELTHEQRGPIRGIVEFLKNNAKADDVVLITYGDLPLKFYTGLEVHGGLAAEELTKLDSTRLRWIIIRENIMAVGPRKDEYVYHFILDHFPLDHLTPIVLDVRDVPFETREDPNWHIFKTPEDAPPVIIFERNRSDVFKSPA